MEYGGVVCCRGAATPYAVQLASFPACRLPGNSQQWEWLPLDITLSTDLENGAYLGILPDSREEAKATNTRLGIAGAAFRNSGEVLSESECVCVRRRGGVELRNVLEITSQRRLSETELSMD